MASLYNIYLYLQTAAKQLHNTVKEAGSFLLLCLGYGMRVIALTTLRYL